MQIDTQTCWNWQGSTSTRGYGYKRINGKTFLVHRVMYEAFNGPIPEGHDVCHKCDNPRCHNPNHLFAGTRLENVRDMLAKGRGALQKRTHCPRGHELAGDNLRTRNDGCRSCATCGREHDKIRMRANRAAKRPNAPNPSPWTSPGQ